MSILARIIEQGSESFDEIPLGVANNESKSDAQNELYSTRDSIPHVNKDIVLNKLDAQNTAIDDIIEQYDGKLPVSVSVMAEAARRSAMFALGYDVDSGNNYL